LAAPGTARLAGVGHQDALEGLGHGSVALADGLRNTLKRVTSTIGLAGTGAASTQEVLTHTIVIAEAVKEGKKRESEYDKSTELWNER